MGEKILDQYVIYKGEKIFLEKVNIDIIEGEIYLDLS